MGTPTAAELMLAKLNKGRKKKIVVASELDTALRILPTASYGFNAMTGLGGIPLRKTTRIYGPKSSGKSRLFYDAIAEVQRRGLIAAIIDTEDTLNDEYSLAWLTACGVDIDQLIILTGPAEIVLDDALAIAQDPAAGFVLIDSVDFLASKEQIDKSMEEMTRAKIAQMMPEFFKKWSALRNSDCGLGLVQQVRANQAAAGNKYLPQTKTSGGFAIEHYVHLDIEVRGKRNKEDDGDGGKEDIGVNSVFKIVKNKINGIYGECNVRIGTDGSIDVYEETIQGAIDKEIVTTGAWMYWGEQKWNGRIKFKADLESNDALFKKLVKAVWG